MNIIWIIISNISLFLVNVVLMDMSRHTSIFCVVILLFASILCIVFLLSDSVLYITFKFSASICYIVFKFSASILYIAKFSASILYIVFSASVLYSFFVFCFFTLYSHFVVPNGIWWFYLNMLTGVHVLNSSVLVSLTFSVHEFLILILFWVLMMCPNNFWFCWLVCDVLQLH